MIRVRWLEARELLLMLMLVLQLKRGAHPLIKNSRVVKPLIMIFPNPFPCFSLARIPVGPWGLIQYGLKPIVLIQSPCTAEEMARRVILAKS